MAEKNAARQPQAGPREHEKAPPRPCCPEPPAGELFLAAETDRLRACLVHAPGRELDRLIPANYRWQLYDDLLHLGRAQAEHRTLRALLGRLGVRVHEFTELLARVYEQMSGTDRRRFLQRVHDVSPGAPLYVLRELSKERDPLVVARALIEGVEATNSFAAEVEDGLYHIQPMSNLIFMQDAAVVLLDRVVQGYMSQLVRMPEEIVVETVIRLSNVFGPRGTGEFWIDPAFRERHRMRRTAREYVQLDAARLSLRLGAVDAPGHGTSGARPPTWNDLPVALGADRVHVELTSAFTSEGRHFILEGGNVLTLRREDGETVVLVGHNARTSADAIDELAYRLLRDDGRHLRGRVGAVIVVDMPEAASGHDGAPHLDTRLLALGEREIAADRSLVEAAAGMPARFFVFRREAEPPVKKTRRKRAPPAASPAPRRSRALADASTEELHVSPKVELARCPTLEEALARAGLSVTVRWIPARTPWEVDDAAVTMGETPKPPARPVTKGETRPPPALSPPDGPAWIALQQSVWAHALNLLSIAPGVLIGLDRHAAFYRTELGAECVDAEAEVLAGALSGLDCCALLAALRARGGPRPVILTIRGDELSRARGGARSLVMPLVREREGA